MIPSDSLQDLIEDAITKINKGFLKRVTGSDMEPSEEDDSESDSVIMPLFQQSYTDLY